MAPASVRHSALLLLLLPLVTLGRSSSAIAAGTPDTWATVQSLSSARAYNSVAFSSSDNRTYSVDGQNSAGLLTALDAYTPSTNLWATATTDSTARAGVGVATGSTGTVYAVGGLGSSNKYLNTASSYVPSTNTGGTLPNLPTARAYLGATLAADGRIYAFGGYNGSYLTTVEAYDPTANVWYCSTSSTKGCTPTSTPPVALPTGRDHAGVVAYNGSIYVIGGQTGASSFTNVVEAYNTSTRTWTCSTGDTATGCSATTLTPMPTSRTVASVLGSNGIIYAVGGYNGSYLGSVEAYNPSTNTWECSSSDTSSGCSATPLVAMPTARAYFGLASGSDSRLYAIGGYNGAYLATVEAYVPLTVPGAPSGATATAGDASATVSWTAPASAGGTPVTQYTVSCSPTCTPVTSSTTSATITGLTNGTSYTFTVTATNFVGTGTASSASNAVTPIATCSTSSSNLSVTGASPGNFSVILNGSDQQVYTSLGAYSAANVTCSGWSLQFQASQFQNANGDKLPAGSLLMAAPTVSSCQSSCGSGSRATAPSVCIHSSSVALDSGSAVTVASAAQSTGNGSYTFTPGSIGTGNLQVSVPSYAYATTYSSTITVTISQGPASIC